MRELYMGNRPIDLLTISAHLQKQGQLEAIGGKQTLVQLSNTISSSNNITQYADDLIALSIRRNFIDVASKIIYVAYNESIDLSELVEESEKSLLTANPYYTKTKDYFDGVELGYITLKNISEARNNPNTLRGVPSGFLALDRITGGWRNGHLIIVAARPGMGKTAWVLSMLERNIVVNKIKGAIFSLEMTAEELMRRLFSINTEVDSYKIDRGHTNDTEFKAISNSKVIDTNLIVDETPGLSIYQFRLKARRFKEKHNIQYIIVDYLQLMRLTNSNGNRQEEVAEISRSLKEIAKELNIPIIALSQLSRSVETRGGDKRPQLSDLRESGSIEQDADIVMFLYRAEYYKVTQDEDGMPTQGMAETIIAKHRGGSLDTVKMRFIGKYTKFRDLDDMQNTHSSWIEEATTPEF